ncbi:MAG: flavodoxin-dependent (E)-4-hydroxy-3-methylbut-2-enyl-diphosphate synthase [Nitrospirota bacterium]|nr:MAG: flavodoxin-dependent (E)-4-hydroxy-3-methylbut-2-enyl-diphosphate synthase [Nitrospirota bacterium]
MAERKQTRRIMVGSVPVGGGAEVAVQSMTKTDTRDVLSTTAQIQSLAERGCEIIRIAVPDEEAARALKDIVLISALPVIADIHFNYKLALSSIESGVSGLRINPGNIGNEWQVKEVVSACKDRSIPIRIGVNAGSLNKKILKKYGHPTPEAIVESAEEHIGILESSGFNDIKVSLKGSNIPLTVEAYRLFSKRYDYPLHIGVSEAGPSVRGVVKSAVGLGILLYEGIGDTIRVSLTAPPEEEVDVAYEILKAAGVRRKGPDIVSCPTCGRCNVNIIEMAEEVDRRLKKLESDITVAVMGCVVNGPGEAREADYGIAGGKGEGLVFRKGEIIKKVKEKDLLNELFSMIEADDR